jgi:hypothetical protein
MIDHNAVPPPLRQDDTRHPQERPLDPYILFVGAFLRQVITDARSTPQRTSDWTEDAGRGAAEHHREAQAFLLDAPRLAPWIELTDADVDKLQEVLLHAAGLTRPVQESRHPSESLP